MDLDTLNRTVAPILLPPDQVFEDSLAAGSEEHYLTSNRKRQKEKRTHASVSGFPTSS